VFVDAGNIWLRTARAPSDTTAIAVANENAKVFNPRTFASQIAVGTGVGIRFDLNFFILRLDLAFPLRKPWLPEHERWVVKDIDFGSRDWRRQNLILNIAIGYPF
jgi:outer membrane protein assembly factor BamA